MSEQERIRKTKRKVVKEVNEKGDIRKRKKTMKKDGENDIYW